MVHTLPLQVTLLDAMDRHILECLRLNLKHCCILSRLVIQHLQILLFDGVHHAFYLCFQKLVPPFELQCRSNYMPIRPQIQPD